MSASNPNPNQWLAGYLESGVLDCQAPHRAGRQVYAGDFYEKARRSSRALAGWSDNRFATFLKEWGCQRIRSGTSQWEFPLLERMRAAFRKEYPWWPDFDTSVAEWHGASAVVVEWHDVNAADFEPDFG